VLRQHAGAFFNMWLDGSMNQAITLYANRPSAWYVAWYEATYSPAVIRQMSVGGSGFASQISRLFLPRKY